jgi:hypothetical protein
MIRSVLGGTKTIREGDLHFPVTVLVKVPTSPQRLAERDAALQQIGTLHGVPVAEGLRG